MLTLITSLLFFAVGTVVLTSGIFTLQSNHKTPANRAFFALTAAIVIWSSGMAMSTTANDAATCEIFRRISAVGWSTVYAILLHFILIITGRAPSLRKWWFYLCLYLPAFFSVFAFAVPNPMNPFPYNLHQTAFGWTNTSQHNIWDWMFYAYYIGYALIGLLLLYRWGAKSAAPVTKKNSRIVRVSIIAALFLGTITDVVLSSVFSELPQMAPAIMLIRIISIYHVLQKDSFSITKGIDKKNELHDSIRKCSCIHNPFCTASVASREKLCHSVCRTRQIGNQRNLCSNTDVHFDIPGIERKQAGVYRVFDN